MCHKVKQLSLTVAGYFKAEVCNFSMLKYVLLSQLDFKVSFKEAILWVDLPEKCLHCGTIKTLLCLVDYPHWLQWINQ